ncbi:MAG: glycosyl hydrolase family 25 [Prevotella sp.]|nr:glycosyl hydrolase family 25 [Prevotella sp.]
MGGCLLSVGIAFMLFVLLVVFAPGAYRQFVSAVSLRLGLRTPVFDRHQVLDYDGIDVSHHQGIIRWDRVAADTAVRFVYIKATEGSTMVDPRYACNLRGARKAGLKVGSYHYLTSASPVSSQFLNFRRQADPAFQDLIPMLDIEAEGLRGWTRKQLRDSISAFIALTVRHYGKPPLLYSYARFYNENLAPRFNQYPLFIARYSSFAPIVHGAGRHHLWQHSDQGVIDGIPTSVDLNFLGDDTELADLMLR